MKLTRLHRDEDSFEDTTSPGPKGQGGPDNGGKNNGTSKKDEGGWQSSNSRVQIISNLFVMLAFGQDSFLC